MQTILPKLVKPTISIVICSFNYERFLAEAIDSALAQTVPCDVVVVDDGSTDGSRRIIESYGERVTAVYQDNAGQLAAYHAGLAHSVGEVMVFLDCDDALEPVAAKQLGAMWEEGVAKVHFRLRLVDDLGMATGALLPSSLARGDVFPGLRAHGLLYPSPPGSGNAYRRSVLEQLFPLPLDPVDFVGADFFTIYGVVAFGTVAACDEPLGRYRVHGQALGKAVPDSSASKVDGKKGESSLTFGNVALNHDEAARVVRRYERMRSWLIERTQGKVVLPSRFLDFSFQKTEYASAILDSSYWRALSHSGPSLYRLLRALWLQPEYKVGKRMGLTAWALLVLLAPRRTGMRLARYVCNPASRS